MKFKQRIALLVCAIVGHKNVRCQLIGHKEKFYIGEAYRHVTQIEVEMCERCKMQKIIDCVLGEKF